MMLLLLFMTGLFAGTVDAVAGGGGLISLPVLLSIGVPPHIAFGTNKVQGMLGTLVAARRFHRQGLISMRLAYKGIFFGLLGSVTGAMLSQHTSSQILYKIIPVLLVIILLYTIASPRVGRQDERPRMSALIVYPLFGFGLGFYDGFFGPGVGSLWVFSLTFFLGFNLIKATAYTKIFNFNSSLVAAICFMVGGNVDYRIAFCMAAGQLVGGQLGAHIAIANGARVIRPVFISVVTLTITSLLYRSYGASITTPHLVEMAIIALILASAMVYYLRHPGKQKTP